MKEKLLTRKQLKTGKVYYNVERNKHTGKVRYVKCFPDKLTLSIGKPCMVVYGIWSNPSSYESLGYIQPIKTKGKKWKKWKKLK